MGTPALFEGLPEGPRLVGYARVSTSEQTAELQRQALAEAGAAVVHVDEGVSGSVMRWPGLEAALAALRAGDTLGVWKLDRLGRSTVGVLQLLRDLDERKIHFRSLTEGFDTRTPAGRALMQMVAVFAELERSTIRERVMAGLDAAKRNGRMLGRRPALKAAQRDHARELLADGRSQAEVARILGAGRSTVQRLVDGSSPSRFERAVGMADTGMRTDEIMSMLRPDD
uniref:recombinase family protein n=1 Tax=Sabulicella glaciei TaxID=2984948 RepID=UPI0034A082C2